MAVKRRERFFILDNSEVSYNEDRGKQTSGIWFTNAAFINTS